MSKYLTHPTNFINRFTEKTYAPDEGLINQLHAYLDMVAITNENLAKAIDMVVADLMRMEGYGKPMSHRQMSEPELIAPTNQSSEEK